MRVPHSNVAFCATLEWAFWDRKIEGVQSIGGSSGPSALDTYLKQQAGQDVRKRVAAVYVLTPDGKTVAGYYTLSQYAVDAGELPEELVRKLHLPKYDKLPATLLGRLARDQQFRGDGLGEILLMGALKRALEHSRNIASVAVVVDAIEEKAAEFYRGYGFMDLPGHRHRLFIPMRTVEELLGVSPEG